MALFWTQRQDIGPSAREGHALAYDASRQRTILFGGFQNDTWGWDGADWTQLQDEGPRPRSWHALAYDSARQRIVLYGGDKFPMTLADTPFADTWEWDGADWTQVQDERPNARSGHAMCFDSVRGRVVLFGGYSAGAELADTWEWDGADWTEVQETGPSARSGHAMCFDSQAPRTLLFGGSALSDTWAFESGMWTQIADTGPPPCRHTALAYARTSFLFGGVDAAASLFGATWELDGVYWTERQDIGPPPRWGHAMSFDSDRGRIVLFGGASATGHHLLPLRDTWELPVPAVGRTPA